MWDKIKAHIEAGGRVVDEELEVEVIGICENRMAIGDGEGVWVVLKREQQDNERFIQLSNFNFTFK